VLVVAAGEGKYDTTLRRAINHAPHAVVVYGVFSIVKSGRRQDRTAEAFLKLQRRGCRPALWQSERGHCGEQKPAVVNSSC
jgi:hypothetical protein